MCLPVSIYRPQAVLEKGVYRDFEYEIVHNDLGYRCGYVKLPPNHPWYGKDYNDLDFVEVHGGLTFAEADESCDQVGEDDGWWIGFDCAHAGDAKDPLLMTVEDLKWEAELSSKCGNLSRTRDTIKTTEYVREECKSLIEQAILVTSC